MNNASTVARSLPLRVAGLAAVAACVAANAVAGDDVGATSARFQTLLTPAPFAFAIWGAIYAAFLAFLAAGLLPRHHRDAAFDGLVGPVVAAHVLGVLWIVLFVREHLLASLAVIAAMLALSVWMLGRVRQGVQSQALPWWSALPFSLLTGWLLVASLVDLTVVLQSVGFSGGAFGATRFTLLLLCSAAAAGVGLALSHRDAVVPAVVAWAAFAIEVQNDGSDEAVARTAFAVALLMAAASLVLGLAVGNGTRQATQGAPGAPLQGRSGAGSGPIIVRR